MKVKLQGEHADLSAAPAPLLSAKLSITYVCPWYVGGGEGCGQEGLPSLLQLYAHGLHDVVDELLGVHHTVLLECKLNFPFKQMNV